MNSYSHYSGVGAHQRQEKKQEVKNGGVIRWKKEKKRIEAQKAKPRTSFPVIDELTGEEEQTGRN